MRRPILRETIERVARRLGAVVEFEPEYGFVGTITFQSGKRVPFYDSRLPLNTNAAVQIARDKAYTAYLMRHFGYSVPQQQTFFGTKLARAIASGRRAEAAPAFADALGYPVYAKPCRLSQGRLVRKVHDDEGLLAAATSIFAEDNVMIVQAYVPGKDYRVVILDGEVLCAYERVPLRVTGDGRRTVQELLEDRQVEFLHQGRDTKLNSHDTRTAECLARRGLTLASTPGDGQVVVLQDVANLSAGGTAIDVTASLHPSVAALATRIASDIGLRFAGIDVIMDDATIALGPYALIEVNSAPGLDNYLYPGLEGVAYADALYERLLRAIDHPPTPSAV